MRLYPLAPAPAATTRAYPSSLSNAEWAVLQPLVRRPATPQGGRPPKHPLRAIVDAIRYLVRTGCAWRLLPRDFPPPGAVYWWVAKWAADGTLARLHDALRERVRAQAGRAPTPTAAIVDSQSVRAADTVPKHSRGWDAGKKVNGRKRHLAVDTLGLLLVVMVTAASVKDPSGRPAAAVAAACQPPRHPPVLGRRRRCWQAGCLGQVRAAPAGRDRPQASWPPVDLRGAAAQVGGGAHACLDQQASPLCRRRRAAACAACRDGDLGHGRGDDPTACWSASATIHPDQRRMTVLRGP